MSESAQDAHTMPPGWYPDPWSPGNRRWWDGAAWTAHVGPPAGGPGAPGQSTDGFAVASLVFGIIGGSILAIVFGFVARGRIKRSPGLKGGQGMATAGIALGSVWLALILVVVVLAVTGVLDSNNADDYSGREQEVARVVDRFEAAADDDGGPERICAELLTPDFARLVSAGSGKPCAEVFSDEVQGKVQAEIDIKSIDLVGARATVRIDEGGTAEKWTLVEGPPGRWRVAQIE